MRRSTLWRFLAIALPTLGALVAALPAVDLAYQLRAGAEILDSGRIPSADAWTFTVAGTPWLDQQWGAQVLLTLVYRLGGWTGLAVLRAGLVGLAFGLLLLVVRRRAPTLGSAGATLLVIGAFLVGVTTLALRPQLFAIDLFAATLLVLAYRDAHPRLVWLIPLVALAWANLHGTFLLAPAVCGLAWFEDLAAMPPSRGVARHRMLFVGLVATVATLVTPFGPAVWGYVSSLTSNPSIAGRVSEWQPPSPLDVSGAIVWLSLLAVAGLLVARITRTVRSSGRLVGAIPWPAVLTLLLFGGFAALSGRGVAWWPLVAVFVIAPWLAPRPAAASTTPADASATPADGSTTPADASATPAERRPPPLLRRLNLAIAAILVLAGVALLPTWRPVGAAGVPLATISYAPQSLGAALTTIQPRTGPTGSPGASRVWNPQTWGSWLEFAAPADRYALDSRIELFPGSIWDDAATISAGNLGALAKYQVDIVVTDSQADAGLEAALTSDPADWLEFAMTCDGAIWLRRTTFPGVLPSPTFGCPEASS
ncbi:MAG TPA: hypothetical protein VJ506_11435 [Candidatus Limnocylindrales bacterium]|nr:hypothetical protein [Candidatus Limnocylindrales bacterium]